MDLLRFWLWHRWFCSYCKTDWLEYKAMKTTGITIEELRKLRDTL